MTSTQIGLKFCNHNLVDTCDSKQANQEMRAANRSKDDNINTRKNDVRVDYNDIDILLFCKTIVCVTEVFSQDC